MRSSTKMTEGPCSSDSVNILPRTRGAPRTLKKSGVIDVDSAASASAAFPVKPSGRNRCGLKLDSGVVSPLPIAAISTPGNCRPVVPWCTRTASIRDLQRRSQNRDLLGCDLLGVVICETKPHPGRNQYSRVAKE